MSCACRHAEADRLIAAFKTGKLPLQAGMTMDASLEAQIQGLLSGIRSSAGDECMRTLAAHNSPLIMSQCGSKGSPVNIAPDGRLRRPAGGRDARFRFGAVSRCNPRVVLQASSPPLPLKNLPLCIALMTGSRGDTALSGVLAKTRNRMLAVRMALGVGSASDPQLQPIAAREA